MNFHTIICYHHLQVDVDTTASLDQLKECYISHNCSMLITQQRLYFISNLHSLWRDFLAHRYFSNDNYLLPTLLLQCVLYNRHNIEPKNSFQNYHPESKFAYYKNEKN